MFTNLFKKSKPFILIDSYHQPTLQYPTLLVLSIDRKDLESYCKQAIKDGFINVNT